jgi:hypothetical protein
MPSKGGVSGERGRLAEGPFPRLALGLSPALGGAVGVRVAGLGDGGDVTLAEGHPGRRAFRGIDGDRP